MDRAASRSMDEHRFVARTVLPGNVNPRPPVTRHVEGGTAAGFTVDRRHTVTEARS